MSIPIKFVEIGLGLLLVCILVVTVSKVFIASDRFQQQVFKNTNESYLSGRDQEIDSLISYDKSVPVTTIYSVLSQKKEDLKSLELNYYVKDANNHLVMTSQKIDFTKGGVVNGTTLSSDSYRTYTLGQLRYLFAERAKVEGSLEEGSDRYNIVITQEKRDFQSTNVS